MRGNRRQQLLTRVQPTLDRLQGHRNGLVLVMLALLASALLALICVLALPLVWLLDLWQDNFGPLFAPKGPARLGPVESENDNSTG